MSAIIPYANMIAGILLLVVGFGFHWIGQLVSVFNWDLATRIGLQEKELTRDYVVYEHAIAVADTAMAWLYGVAAVGLFFNAQWGYKLASIPGSILVYHAISAWVWEGNRRAAGRRLWSDARRIGWCAANAFTGILVLLVAWTGQSD